MCVAAVTTPLQAVVVAPIDWRGRELPSERGTDIGFVSVWLVCGLPLCVSSLLKEK